MEVYRNLANNHLSDTFCKYCGAELSRSRFVEGRNGAAGMVYWDACICCDNYFRIRIFADRIDDALWMPIVEIFKRRADREFRGEVEGEIAAPALLKKRLPLARFDQLVARASLRKLRTN